MHQKLFDGYEPLRLKLLEGFGNKLWNRYKIFNLPPVVLNGKTWLSASSLQISHDAQLSVTKKIGVNMKGENVMSRIHYF